MVDHVEVLVEEPSMELALRELLPKLLGLMSFQIYTHQGKDDLIKHLPNRLRGYAAFIPANWKIFIIVDRDDDDCIELKQQLETIAEGAGLITASKASADSTYSVVNRIAIEELEAWYFGDWDAARAAYPKLNPNIPEKAPYRYPDQISGGTWEAFERVAKTSGYFKTGLRKMEAAKEISQHFEIERNSSPSFRTFCSAVKRLTEAS
jgi:hypothetical protein